MKMSEVKYSGSRSPCKNKMPHPAHLISYYETVANGRLEHFCPGISGNGIEIEEEILFQGSAYYPTVAKYRWTHDPNALPTHTVEIEYMNFPGDWIYIYENKIVEHETAYNHDLALRFSREKGEKHPEYGKFLAAIPQPPLRRTVAKRNGQIP